MTAVRNTCSVISLISRSCLDWLEKNQERIRHIWSVRCCPWFLWVTSLLLTPFCPCTMLINHMILPSGQRSPDPPHGQRQTVSVLDFGTQVASFPHGLFSQVANWHILPSHGLGHSQNQFPWSLRREKEWWNPWENNWSFTHRHTYTHK